MATTLKDIADRLEISKGAVSRVLNGKPGVWASPETQQRIFELARELNYMPSASAKALATGRTLHFAVSPADPDLSKGSTGRLQEISGLMVAAAQYGYRLLMLADNEGQANSFSFREAQNTNACDGFFVFAEQVNPEVEEFLDECKLPFIIIGDVGHDRWSRIDWDNERYIINSATWLKQAGHDRIAFVTPYFSRPAVLRMHQAFDKVVQKLGLYTFEQFRPRGPLHREQVEQYLVRTQPEAIIVVGLSNTLLCQRAVESYSAQSGSPVQILAHLDPPELTTLRRSELSSSLAFNIYDPQLTGQRAVQAMMNVVENHRQETTLILPAPPFMEGEPHNSPYWDRMPQVFDTP